MVSLLKINYTNHDGGLSNSNSNQFRIILLLLLDFLLRCGGNNAWNVVSVSLTTTAAAAAAAAAGVVLYSV